MPASQHPSPTLRDCVYGQAVGDALGVPYEFRARGTFKCTDMVGHGSHNQPAGTWSDDTSMALCIASLRSGPPRHRYLSRYRHEN
jgi:ADP-ribosylglycohydrolase